MSFLILAAKICLYSTANIRIVSGKFCPGAGGWEREPPTDIIVPQRNGVCVVLA